MATSLAGFGLSTDPASFHLWLKMPDEYRSDAFAAAASRAGIAVTTWRGFVVAPCHAPQAVKLAFSPSLGRDMTQ